MPDYSALMADWQALLARRPALGEPLRFWTAILEGWAADECRGRWERGVSLLAEARPVIPSASVEELLGPVMERLAADGPEAVEAFQRLALAWDEGQIGASALLPALRELELARPGPPGRGGSRGGLLHRGLSRVSRLREGRRSSSALERGAAARGGLGLPAPRSPRRARGLLARDPLARAPAPARGRRRAVNAVLFDVALTAYILAAVAAIGSLAGRRDQLAWVALLLTQAGFICHTGAVILRGIELRRLPVSTLAEMVSLLIWAVILLDFWVERQRRIRPLSAFVLPVVLALGLGLPTGLRSIVLEPPVRSGWIMVHVALVLVGLAALVLNFGGALMYLLVERQLKAKRVGAVYYRLPPLETLDRLTIATLTVAFPFLTVGLALGALSARGAWGSVVAFDPLALFSLVMWVIYTATLLGRVLGHWRGRRAAYLSIAGFCAMLVTLSA